MPTRTSIAATYNLGEKVLGSWMHHLTHIRNLCAHHSRLWDRELVITPKRPKNKSANLKGEFVQGSRKIYNTFLVLLHLMDIIAPNHRWRQRLKTLLENPNVSLEAMGFLEGWEERDIWVGDKTAKDKK